MFLIKFSHLLHRLAISLNDVMAGFGERPELRAGKKLLW